MRRRDVGSLEVDAAELAAELGAGGQVRVGGTRTRTRRFFELTPGQRALYVVDLALAAPLIGMTIARALPVEGWPAVAGLVALAALELFIVMRATRFIWARLGAAPRGMVRALFRWWWVGLLLAFPLAVAIANALGPRLLDQRAASLGIPAEAFRQGHRGPLAGTNWRYVLDDDFRFTPLNQAAARDRCRQLGLRLPSVDDLARLEPLPVEPGRVPFWLAEPTQQSSRFSLVSDPKPGRSFQLLLDGAEQATRAAALCVR